MSNDNRDEIKRLRDEELMNGNHTIAETQIALTVYLERLILLEAEESISLVHS